MNRQGEQASVVKLAWEFSAPLGSVVLMMLGTAFFLTFISVLFETEGYSRREIGYIHAAYYLGMFLGAFGMERVIARIGHIQALTVFGSVATSTVVMQALFPTFPVWLLMRFVMGLSIAAIYIVIESWMLQHSRVRDRGVVLSLYMACLYTSQALSQQFLGWLDISSITPFLVAALFTSLSVIPVGLSTRRIQLHEAQDSLGLFKIFRISPFGVTGCFVSGLILSAIYSFFPIYALKKEISSDDLMTITIFGGVLLQWPLGKLSDYFERRRTLLLVVLMGLGLTSAGFFYTGSSNFVTLSLVFLIGGFSFTLYPLSITQVCDHLDHTLVTKATGLLLVSYGLGSVLGPLFSSWVIESMGIQALFLYFTALLAGLGLVGTYTKFNRPIIPMGEQRDFLLLPRVTPIVYEMDPRQDN